MEYEFKKENKEVNRLPMLLWDSQFSIGIFGRSMSDGCGVLTTFCCCIGFVINIGGVGGNNFTGS